MTTIAQNLNVETVLLLTLIDSADKELADKLWRHAFWHKLTIRKLNAEVNLHDMLCTIDEKYSTTADAIDDRAEPETPEETAYLRSLMTERIAILKAMRENDPFNAYAELIELVIRSIRFQTAN